MLDYNINIINMTQVREINNDPFVLRLITVKIHIVSTYNINSQDLLIIYLRKYVTL